MKGIKRFGLVLAVLVLTVFALVGCGGGGGSSSGGGGGGAATAMNAFVTDDLSTTYDHVWVNLYSVDLIKSDGTAFNIDTSATGQQIDLASLHDSSNNPLYLFLGKVSIPAGSYNGFSLTLGESVTLFAKGATTSTTATFPTALTAGPIKIASDGTKSVVGVTFGAPKTFTDGENFHIDCVLKNWTINGSGNIVPDIKQGDGNGDSDSGHQESTTIEGQVFNLNGTAPAQTFDLVIPGDSHRTVPVTVSADTTIANSDASANPVLANSDKVGVQGKFDPTTKTFAATSIIIRVSDNGGGGGGTPPTAETSGTGGNGNSTAGTFDLTVMEAHGFIPSKNPVQVQTSSTTKFMADGSAIAASDFFGDLVTVTTPHVRAEGTYDAAANVFTATSVGVQTGTAPQPEVHISGPVASETATSSLTMTLTEWDGFQGSQSLLVTVNTAGSTKYQGLNGETLTADAFFAAATVGAVIQVDGKLTATATVTADALRLRHEGSGGGGDHAEIFGVPANVTSTGFDVFTIRWDGFLSSYGTVEHITFADNAEFRDKHGATVTKDQFLADVNAEPKRSVTADGTVNIGTSTLNVVRIFQNK